MIKGHRQGQESVDRDRKRAQGSKGKEQEREEDSTKADGKEQPLVGEDTEKPCLTSKEEGSGVSVECSGWDSGSG